jgi:hypothetical protein
MQQETVPFRQQHQINEYIKQLPYCCRLFFAFSLLLFLAASINDDLALGFVLTFYLASAALVAMLHTFRNQVHLCLTPLKAEPAFAGKPLRYCSRTGAHQRAAL